MSINSSERITQYNKDLITEIAGKLFFTKGISQTSVAEIAKAGHISRVTIYKYFQTKNDIAKLVLHRYLHEWSPCIRKTFFSEEYPTLTGFEQIRLQLFIFAEMHLENPEYLPFLSELNILSCKDSEIRDCTKTNCKTYLEFNEFYANALQKGLKDGSICSRLGFEEDDYLFVRKIMEGICLKQYLFYGRKYFISNQTEVYDMLISAADKITNAFYKPDNS